MQEEIIYFLLGISLSSVTFLLAFAWFYVQNKKWILRYEKLTTNLMIKLKEADETRLEYKNELHKLNKSSERSPGHSPKGMF